MVKEKFLFLLSLLVISFVFAVIPDVAKKLTDNSAVILLTQIVAAILNFIVDAGLIYVMLRLYDGKDTKIEDLFSQYPITFRYFVAVALYGVTAFIGMILLVVPGVYFMLRFQFYRYFLVDKKMGIMESFRASSKITDGQKWQLFRFALAIFGVNLLGLIVLGVGLIVTIPLSSLATAYVYRKLSSPVAEPAELVRDTPIIMDPISRGVEMN